MFGDPKEKKITKIEKIKQKEEYFDKLIKVIEHKIDMFSPNVKKKIAEDAVEKPNSWFGLLKYHEEFEKNKTNNDRKSKNDKADSKANKR